MVRSVQPYEELTPSRRRRLVASALGRSLFVAIVVTVAYYVLPLDRPLHAGLLVLVVGLFAVVAVIVWEVRTIITSPFPRLRAIAALMVGLPLFIVVFAAVYYVIAKDQADAFTQPLGKTDSLYFTVTVFATVGFGDITAKSELGRVTVLIQMILDLVLLGVVVKVLLGAVQLGLQRRSVADENPASHDPTEP